MEVNKNFSKKALKDLELVEAAKGGSQSAYSEIMSRYRDTIYFLILKMIRNESDAEDLTIESFGKAFKKLDQYTPQYAFSTWLFRIATNHAIDFIRKKRVKTTSIDEAMEDSKGNSWNLQVGGTSKDPEEKYIEKQKIKLMRKYVDQIDEPYKTLVNLRYFQEWTYEEIATDQKIPLGTVKAQLFRARAILSDMIEKSKKSI